MDNLQGQRGQQHRRKSGAGARTASARQRRQRRQRRPARVMQPPLVICLAAAAPLPPLREDPGSGAAR
jgi:hypothetical protein